MRFRATLLLGLSLLWLLLGGGDGRTQDAQPTEYQIKAAFLFNFARFVQWPPRAMPNATSPMVIGVLGQNPFHEDLARTIQNKTVDDHPIQVKEYGSLAEATNCHILFISTSEKARMPKIINGLKGTSVLTVGEMDQFTESGGMINFVLQGTKIRFQINNDAATSAGLKISSKLLALAVHPAR
jgi:YfiR/HmsC-like